MNHLPNHENLKGRIAYSYVRFSSKKQEQGDSLRRQTELSNNFVLKHGLILDTSLHLQDLGVSGFRGANVQFGALGGFLAAIGSGRVPRGSILLVESLDRLSRAEIPISLGLFLGIINAGVDIATLLDEHFYSQKSLDVEGLLKSLLVLSRGHEESQTKSERVRIAKRQKVQKARELNGAYRITKMGPGWLKANAAGGWDIIPERADVIREIFNLYDQGLGKWRIASKLTQRGISTFKGAKSWSARYVASVLTNPAVVGRYRPGHWVGGTHRYLEGQDIEHYFPPIISLELFNRCYARIKGHYAPPVRPGKIHLLAGIVHCGHKNEKCVIQGTSKKELLATGETTTYRYYYYIPGSVLLHRGQEYRSWRADLLERSFLLFSQSVDWAAIATTKSSLPKMDWAGARQRLEDRAQEIKKNIGNLYAIAAARGDVEGIVDEIVAREKEQAKLRADINALVAEEEIEKAAELALNRGGMGNELMTKVLQDGGDQDTRMRLREEIRQRVEKITLYSMGYDLGSRVERETSLTLNIGKVRCYVVTFKNGATRWVVPAGKNDTAISCIYDENSSYDAMPVPPLEFNLPEKTRTHCRRGRKKSREWTSIQKITKPMKKHRNGANTDSE